MVVVDDVDGLVVDVSVVVEVVVEVVPHPLNGKAIVAMTSSTKFARARVLIFISQRRSTQYTTLTDELHSRFQFR